MQTPFLKGELIYLRPLGPGDAGETYLGWLNDPEVTRYLETGVFPTTLAELERYCAGLVDKSEQVMLAIVDRASDRHIGNIKLGPINWVHRRATLGILVGDREFWGRGVGTEATRLLVDYAFGRLGLNRVDLGVHAEHAAAVRVYERIGFKVEGRFREDLFHEGRHRDRLWMGLLKSEYRKANGAS